MLSSDSNPAGPPSDLKAISSFIIFRAESIEKVREIVESDLFYTEDIVSAANMLYCEWTADGCCLILLVGQGGDPHQSHFGCGSGVEMNDDTTGYTYI